MDAAIIALSGGLVGATATALYTRWNERIKWERDREARDNQYRIEAYSRLLAAA
jgi:hypothetical protein